MPLHLITLSSLPWLTCVMNLGQESSSGIWKFSALAWQRAAQLRSEGFTGSSECLALLEQDLCSVGPDLALPPPVQWKTSWGLYLLQLPMKAGLKSTSREQAVGFQSRTEFSREESIALGLGKQPFCLAKDSEVLKCIYFPIGNDSTAF